MQIIANFTISLFNRLHCSGIMELLSRAGCCVNEYDFNLNHFYFCDLILFYVCVTVSIETQHRGNTQMSLAVCTQGLAN